jgi:hypothetical protein
VSMLLNERRRCLMTSRISTSLCHIILESPKLNDAPLFMLFLTTDLNVIEKWGYNGASATTVFFLRWLTWFIIHQLVDRILRQQKSGDVSPLSDPNVPKGESVSAKPDGRQK